MPARTYPDLTAHKEPPMTEYDDQWERTTKRRKPTAELIGELAYLVRCAKADAADADRSRLREVQHVVAERDAAQAEAAAREAALAAIDPEAVALSKVLDALRALPWADTEHGRTAGVDRVLRAAGDRLGVVLVRTDTPRPEQVLAMVPGHLADAVQLLLEQAR